MKMLLANKYFYEKGGAEKSFFQTANLLRKHNHQTVFFSMDHPRNFETENSEFFIKNIDYEKINIFNLFDTTFKILYSFEAKRKMARLIEQEKPDIAHLNNIYHQISPSIIHSLKKNNIPIVMTLRDYKMVCASYLHLNEGLICESCKNGKHYNCLIKGCVKDSYAKSIVNTIEMYLHHYLLNVYNLVDVFIAPSLFLKNKIGEMGFKRKIEFLPNFVLLDGFEPVYESVENTITYFGRLSREKGLFTLIEAMKNVNTTLKIIGEGPLKRVLEEKVSDESIPNVRFLGYRKGEELKEEIKKTKFTILTSECYENNPRSIIESFALGKPAIGSRIGGIPELIFDGETGWTFEAGNAKDLISKIGLLLNKPEDIKKMGKKARSLIEKKLNAESHYEQLMSIYQSLV